MYDKAFYGVIIFKYVTWIDVPRHEVQYNDN